MHGEGLVGGLRQRLFAGGEAPHAGGIRRRRDSGRTPVRGLRGSREKRREFQSLQESVAQGWGRTHVWQTQCQVAVWVGPSSAARSDCGLIMAIPSDFCNIFLKRRVAPKVVGEAARARRFVVPIWSGRYSPLVTWALYTDLQRLRCFYLPI